MKKNFDNFQVSVAASLVIASSVISFKEYFLVNPFAGDFGLLSSLQGISLAALLILILVPPLLLAGSSNLTNLQNNALIFAALAWPVSLMVVRIAIWQATGLFVFEYWISYPILFLCEFGVTSIYIYMAVANKSFTQIKPSQDYIEAELNKV